MSSILNLVKFIFIVAGTVFLSKKSERHEALRVILIACGAFCLSLIVIFIVFSIVGEFFAK